MKRFYPTFQLLFIIFLSLILLSNKSFGQVWNRKINYPGSGGRALSSAFSIPSLGKGYVVGGGNTGYQYDVWEYDTLLGSWRQLPNFPGASSGHVAFSIDGKGYVGTGTGGGYSWSNLFFEYDPVSNTWIPKASFPGAPRAYATGFSVGGKGYIGGGTHGYNFNGLKDFYEYDPSNDTWKRVANCPAKGVANLAVGFSIGNKGYVGTGAALDSIASTQTPQKDFWEYDPAIDTWTQKADFGGGTRSSAIGIATCDKGYIGTGNSDPGQTILYNDFWQYDPVNDIWKQIASVGDTSRELGIGFAIGQSLYMGTGRLTVYGGYINDWWEYHVVYTPAFATGGLSSTHICAGQSVSYTDTSNFHPDSWLWSFPGGTPDTSTEQNPTIQYNTPGMFDVTLSAWNACDSAGKTFPQYVTVGAGTTLTISPPTPKVCSGQTITLSVNGGGSTFKWSPSTGLSKATGDSVIATGQSSVDSIVYTVVDTSGSGCPASGQVTVQIGGSAVAGSATAIRDTICQGTSGNLSLSGNSSSAIQWQSSTDSITFSSLTNDTVANYKTSPLLNTTWYRAEVGIGACLAFSDTVQLFVPPALTAYFSAVQTTNNGLTFNSDSSVGNIRSYHWDFGDNTTSTDKNPQHTYTKDTTYYVCLTLYDGSNCSYTFCRYSEVTDGIPFISASGNWVIYPNPFSNQLNIRRKQMNGWIQSIELYDVLGRPVINRNADATNNTLSMDVSSLANGMYYLIIRTMDENYVQKVIKQ